MRQLTIKQKNLLKKWYKEAEPNEREKLILGTDNKLFTYDDLSSEKWETLQNINDTEILHSEVNRYIEDLRWSSRL